MIEQKMRSALLFLAGSLLAAGAWGQSVKFVQSTVGKVTVASEYFGTGAAGRTVSFVGDTGDKQPMVVLEIINDAGSTLGEGNEAELTFALNGATFVSPVTVNSLKYYDNLADNPPGEDPDAIPTANPLDLEGDNMSRSVKSGGARGDSSVTFTLKVDTGINVDVGVNPGQEFLGFKLPALQVVPASVTSTMRGVTVVATLRSVTNRSNSFPSAVHGLTVPTAERPLVPAVGGVVRVNPATEGLVLSLAQALTTTLTDGVDATVSLTDRKVIAATGGGAGMPVTKANGDKVRGLLIGKVAAVMGADTIKVLDSNVSIQSTTTTLHSSLNGNLDITVSGRMQEGDAVILGADQTKEASKAFTMGENGVATLGLVLGEIASMDMIYVPGGVADLRPAVFTATATVDFNDDRNDGGPVTAGAAPAKASSMLSYQGVNPAAYAYGVVRSTANGGMETSFLRVTCADTPAGCSVFLDCTGQDGTEYFNQISAAGSERIANNATEVFTSNEIAAALPGGGWESGRGRCDLLSNGNLQVQHMIRSGGIQVNNSVVIDDTGIITNAPATGG